MTGSSSPSPPPRPTRTAPEFEPATSRTPIRMEAEACCPYCGEPISFWVDESGGRSQNYVEDCAVCCRPIDVRVVLEEDAPGAAGGWRVQAHRGDE